MVGRSSFHIGPLEPVEHLQTLKGYCVWGVGLLIPSSENAVTAKFAELTLGLQVDAQPQPLFTGMRGR
jgi:hypothetical protein